MKLTSQNYAFSFVCGLRDFRLYSIGCPYMCDVWLSFGSACTQAAISMPYTYSSLSVCSLVFPKTVSLCSSGSPQICFVDQGKLKCRDLSASASQELGIKVLSLFGLLLMWQNTVTKACLGVKSWFHSQFYIWVH